MARTFWVVIVVSSIFDLAVASILLNYFGSSYYAGIVFFLAACLIVAIFWAFEFCISIYNALKAVILEYLLLSGTTPAALHKNLDGVKIKYPYSGYENIEVYMSDLAFEQLTLDEYGSILPSSIDSAMKVQLLSGQISALPFIRKLVLSKALVRVTEKLAH